MKQPLSLSLYVYQGQTFDDSLALANADGTAIDLTGFTAHLQAREEITDTTPLVDWSSDAGTIVINGAAGTLTFAVPADATAALATGNEPAVWRYDLRIVNTVGYAERVVQGTMNISPAVTRS